MLASKLMISCLIASWLALAGSTTIAAPSTASLSISAQSQIPHPYTRDPAEVLENIVAICSPKRACGSDGVPELDTGKNVHVRRVLYAHTMLDGSDYLSVELDDDQERPLATFVMDASGGNFRMLIPYRGVDPRVIRRSLDLEDARKRVTTRMKVTPTDAEYIHFWNFAEPYASSLDVPLVAVPTEEGIVYLNSQGEAFAEATSPLVARFEGRPIRPMPDPPDFVRLRRLTSW